MKRTVSITLLLSLFLLFSAFQLQAENLVVNGEFDDGLTGWQGWIDEASSEVQVVLDTDAALSGANSMRLDIVKGSADIWRVQRNQRINIVEGHVYEATFMGKASKDGVRIELSSQHDADPYQGHMNVKIDLTTEPQLFGPFTLTPLFTDDINNFGFFLGGTDDVSIWIDAVELVDVTPPPPPDPDIIWVSGLIQDSLGVYSDQGFIDLLTDAGYVVQEERDTITGKPLTDEQKAVLESADLVIVSRSTNSGTYNSVSWNSVKVPVILTTSYLSRANRWQWFDNDLILGNGDSGAPLYEAADPTHPIFNGVTLDGNNQAAILDGTVGSGNTSISAGLSAGNGQILATVADTGSVAIAFWPQYTVFHDGTKEWAADHRMLFNCGARETASGVVPAYLQGLYNLTDDGATMFLNAVDWMINLPPSPPPPAEPVVMASHPPAIDGKLDPIWKHTPWVRDFVYPSGATTFNDAALSWRAMWDYDYLYLFITVVDDIFNAETQTGWHGDSVELWLDGDNSKGTTYDGINDLGYTFLYSNDPNNPLIFNPSTEWRLGTTGHIDAAAYWEGGVNLEIAIPMENLGITPTPGHMLGMDVDWNDRDGDSADRDTKVKWFDATDNSWDNPSLMGTLRLVDRVVYDYTDVWYTEMPPVIDGQPDDLSEFPVFELNQYMASVDSLHNWDADMKLQYQVVWDDSYVYYQVHVKDDVLVQDGAYNHQDDGIELWLDGDFSHGTSYDGINDIGASFKYVPGGGLDSLNAVGWAGSGHYVWGPGTIMSASSPTDDGVFLEFAVAMDSVDMKPINGFMFGHELDYNDDDTGGDRDTKAKTHAPVDETWQNPSYMSGAKLMGGPGGEIVADVIGLKIDKTAVAPEIDGVMEPLWDPARNYRIGKQQGTADDWWDSYGYYKILYDANNLYMFVTVHDDVLDTQLANDYEKDSIELFLDGDNSKNTLDEGEDPWAWPPVNYDDNDDQFRFVYGGVGQNGSLMGRYDTSGAQMATVETAYGWNLEVSMPLKGQPLTATPGSVIGFEIAINDADGGTARENTQMWWGETGEAWHDPSVLGTAMFTDRQINHKDLGRVLPIPFTPYPIKVDAEMDYGWEEVATVFGNHRMNTPDSMSTPDDAEMSWKAAWDFDYLYFWINVVDDVLLFENSSSTWADDGIEFWFDGNGDQTKSWDGVFDQFLKCNYNEETVLSPIVWGAKSPSPALDSTQLASIKQAKKLTDKGLVLEVAFPLDVLNIEPGFGSKIALDLDWNDSDTPGLDRDTKIKAFDPTDGVWGNSNLMGLAMFTGSVLPSEVESDVDVVVTTYELRQNYPNPFNPTTTIEFAIPEAQKVKLTIYDILGRRVVTLLDQRMDAGIHSVTFDAAKFASGVYLYSLQTNDRVLNKKMMLIK